GFVLGGGLMRGGGEVLIAASALAPARRGEALTRMREIVEPLAGHFIVHHGAHRNLDFDGAALGAGSIAAFAVTSASRFVLRVKAKLEESIDVLAGYKDDVAAAPSIAAAWAAARNVLLATKGQAAVAAIAGLHQYSY